MKKTDMPRPGPRSVIHNLSQYDPKHDQKNREIYAAYALLSLFKRDGRSRQIERVKKKLKNPAIMAQIADETPIESENDMKKFAIQRKVNIYFWSVKIYGHVPKKLKLIDCEERSPKIKRDLHLVAPNLNEINGWRNGLYDLKIIIDLDNYRKRFNGVKEYSIWTILSRHVNKSVEQLQGQWKERTGSLIVMWEDEVIIHEIFGLGFRIRIQQPGNGNKKVKVICIHNSGFQEKLHLEYSGSKWPKRCYILESDLFLDRNKKIL